MTSTTIRWSRFASPATFYPLAGRLVPWFMALAVLLCAAGLWEGFFVAPTDAQQGEGYRIIFLHVPASWMSMVIYVAMAFALVVEVVNMRLRGPAKEEGEPEGVKATETEATRPEPPEGG